MSDPSTVDTRPDDLSLNTAAAVIGLYLKGLAMGLGDSVPGVSGGTIAVITNIYDRLIFSIRAIDLAACKFLLAGQLRPLWRHVNGSFLLILFFGILSGLLLSANTVLFLLADYYALLMAFFIGLVCASCWLLKREFNVVKWTNLCALCVGILFVSAIGFVEPRSVEINYLYVFFSGMVAICAMILPGLSGAFVLLLLGVYEFILGALVNLDLPYILVFASGCGIGLLAFSRLLASLLSRHHQLSYGFITGLLLGSIPLLWPWRQSLSVYLDSSGESHVLSAVNVSPFEYAKLSGEDPMLLAALLSIIAGALLLVLLNWLSNSKFGSE